MTTSLSVEPGVDAFCSSGPSPTDPVRLHLLGVGAVGRALLRLAGPAIRVVGATDSRGTVLAPHGLDVAVLIREKTAGLALTSIPDFHHAWEGDAEPSAGAAVVVDATPTELSRGAEDARRIRQWLQRGQRVALASKHALTADPSLLDEPGLGANAVLGGTGAELQRELSGLRETWTAVALAGNASTTTIISCIEQGGTFADGLAIADAQGVLEADPELDLRGADAAAKLALVVGALTGRPRDPESVDVQDLRQVPVESLRAAAREGRTTRLVARARREGALSLGYEVLDRTHPLAVGPEAVAYRYEQGDTVQLHRGTGVGAIGTARALFADVERLGRSS